MTDNLDSLRRLVLSYTPLAMNYWDTLEADPDSLKNLLATTIDNRTDRAQPVRLDGRMVFPRAHRIGDQPITSVDQKRWKWAVVPAMYAAVDEYAEENLNRPQTVGDLKSLIAAMPSALNRLQSQMLMEVFRQNVLGRDGQNFFDATHPYPNAVGTYDNTVSHGFTVAGVPTFDEVKSLYYNALTRFQTNQALLAEVLDLTNFKGQLAMFAHNEIHAQVMLQVASNDHNGQSPNELKGKFRVFRDMKPTAGQENRIEILLVEPNGPRPSFFALDSDPVLATDETDINKTGKVGILLKQSFGVASAFPHTTLQAS